MQYVITYNMYLGNTTHGYVVVESLSHSAALATAVSKISSYQRKKYIENETIFTVADAGDALGKCGMIMEKQFKIAAPDPTPRDFKLVSL